MTKVCYNHIDGTREKGLVMCRPGLRESIRVIHPLSALKDRRCRNVIFTLSFLQQKGENALRNGSSVLPNAALRCIILQ